VKNNLDNQIHNITLCNMCFPVYIGVRDEAPEAGEFSKIFVLKVTLQPARLLLARDSIYAIARYMPSPIRPYVRLSVTRVDQSKTVEARITQPSPQSSPMTLVS